MLSLSLLVVGLIGTWGWGQADYLAAASDKLEEAESQMLYTAWQPSGSHGRILFRSADAGATWQALEMPEGKMPVAWADDGANRLVVVLEGGAVIRSDRAGDHWKPVVETLRVTSLAWDEAGVLYLGTDGQGVYRQIPSGVLLELTGSQAELAESRVVSLAVVDDRLYVATPTAIFLADDQGQAWTKSLPLPDRVSAMAVADQETLYVGTETTGVYRSTDAGRTWEPALVGLGLTAGQMVRVTALHAEPEAPGVLYATVDHLVGSTQVHASAAGAFVTVDGGDTWLPLMGPGFPEARHALSLIPVPGRPLYVHTVTTRGLQDYEPDVAAALVALSSPQPADRIGAARMLGLARAAEASLPLVAALADPSSAVSMTAAVALGQIGDPASVNGLLLALEHPDEQVRLGAARALGMMKVEAAVDTLRSMLVSGEGAEVGVAAEALGHLDSPAAMDALLVALADQELTPRRHASLAVLETLGEPAVQPLAAMLASEDAFTRRNAAEALGWIGSPSATALLSKVVRQDETATVRRQAAWALGEIGDPAGRPALARAIARDVVPEVRAEAEWALAHVEAATAAQGAPSLVRLLQRYSDMRWLLLAAAFVGAAAIVTGPHLRPSLRAVTNRNARL